jgi:hypothetical protein
VTNALRGFVPIFIPLLLRSLPMPCARRAPDRRASAGIAGGTRPARGGPRRAGNASTLKSLSPEHGCPHCSIRSALRCGACYKAGSDRSRRPAAKRHALSEPALAAWANSPWHTHSLEDLVDSRGDLRRAGRSRSGRCTSSARDPNRECRECSLAFEPVLRRQERHASRTASRLSRARSWSRLSSGWDYRQSGRF